jgi:hypothetical protein
MNAGSLFARMSSTILSALGGPALFGADNMPTQINIQFCVQLQGMQTDSGAFAGEYTTERDVATIDGALQPVTGNTFRMLNDDGSTRAVYRLDKLLRNNGYNRQFVILQVV